MSVVGREVEPFIEPLPSWYFLYTFILRKHISYDIRSTYTYTIYHMIYARVESSKEIRKVTTRGFSIRVKHRCYT